MQRTTLIFIIKLMFFALFMGTFFVFMRSVGGPSQVNNTQQVFDDIMTGQTALRRLGDDKVWATRLSAMQRNHMVSLKPQLVEPDAGCTLAQVLCVLKAATSRSGIDVIYSSKRPPQLRKKAAWHGGYVDPTSGQVFDLMGRAYKSENLFNTRNKQLQATLELVPFEPSP